MDGNGIKVADSRPGISSNDSFSELESFQNAIRGESGSTVEVVNQTTLSISYYPVEALQNTWAVLWMRLISGDIAENSTATAFG